MLFKAKPYQGQEPERASVIYIGRDANYSEAISDHPFFERILEYHEDGVAFWQRHGVHHPFLLSSHPFSRIKGGVKYHSTFSKMDLGTEAAPLVSFVELLDVPTIGITSQDKQGVFDSLIRRPHLEYLESLLSGNQPRLVFISPSVLMALRKMRKKFGLLSWLDDCPRSVPNAEQPLLIRDSIKIYLTYHFSDYRVHAQLPAMARLIRSI
jgi:hypothetical protein